MSGFLVQNGKQSFSDANGRPLVGGKVYFFFPGTQVLKDTWQDINNTVLNTNPVILDARGEASIYGNGTYRQVLRDAAGNLIWDQLVPDLSATSADKVSYIAPDGTIHTVQDMSGSGGGDLVNMGGMTQTVMSATGDETATPYSAHFIRTTNKNSDAIFAERIATGATSTGYAVHALDSGTGSPDVGTGGAIGGATSRLTYADAIVGNRRLTGEGNGGSFSRLESGAGHGVYGFRAGSGAGDGVYGYMAQTAQGHAVHGRHEGSMSGAGGFFERLNGAGQGPAVLAHAIGVNGAESASVMAIKVAGDGAPAILADARGSDPAIRAFTAASATAKAVESLSDVTSTAPTSNTFERDYGAQGICVLHRVNGATARTGAVIATVSTVAPTANSTGASNVTGHALTIGSNVSGSAEASGASYDVLAKNGASAFGAKAVVNGANTVNYGLYGNAVGGTTNWSGYFVGNVFYGGALTPSDRRLKTIHGEVDYSLCLENVLANPIYCYDKEAAYMADIPVWSEVEDRVGNLIVPTYGKEERRHLVAIREIGNLAQDIQKTNPDFITTYAVGDTDYLSVSDRSELFQLKAAFKYLVETLRSKGVDV
ncbi:hypothetical protein YA0721_05705 [Pseudomonas carnis]|uniref:hypothetical protein n=1 Tax=Pseudomonas carnis TaxID=2487355 RepID=UPI0018E5E0A3|nr:hypothetical protein [Pseudomonas carnis]MBI6655615.1 hypothetical protein [Pseudomonas carnis]MBI6660551.1 hypothetical protein [Pseudomonas carnis]MBI6689554.1 hypothetical protein [Pseudomonas carnis]